MPRMKSRIHAAAVDLFCGAGGITRGLMNAGIPVIAGYDIDGACKYPYEQNNPPAFFVSKSVSGLSGRELRRLYPKRIIKILVGCAPCQPFSTYTQRYDTASSFQWGLLHEFGRLVRELKPEIVSMENVPDLQKHSVFTDFLSTLKEEGYYFEPNPEKRVVYCPDFGVPQHRSRIVLLASRLGPISLIPPTHRPDHYRKVRDVLWKLPPIGAGEVSSKDPLHQSSRLSALNLSRIRHSRPGGTWRTWPPHLIADCHQEKSGKTYPGVYGRMEWDKTSPTITTQFYGFGNGRFGHPVQDRALSLREGAILQTFPRNYQFVEPGAKCHFKTIGRMIGNAVPVRLGEIIGRSIKHHIETNTP